MKQYPTTLAMLAILAVASTTLAGGTVQILSDGFTNLNQWNDLSKAVTWGGNTTPTSVFNNSSGTVTMDYAAQAYSGYGNETQSLTFTCLDHQFAKALDRSHGQTITVEFTAKWDGRSLSGEGSRFNVAMMHDYPTGGLDMDLDDKYNDFSNDWWARPAYNMRIRTLSDDALMMFGGGVDVEGEVETYGSNWWLAGFSSSPGGFSPQSTTPGVVGCGTGRYSQSQFKTYQYVFTPTHQLLYYDGQLVGSQDISAEFQAITDKNGVTQNFRKNFHTLEGIRLFWRGANNNAQAIIDDINVTVSDIPNGDADLDGLIGLSDLSILAGNYGTNSGMGWMDGDFDNNNAVGLSDLSILAGQYGSTTPVPEPATLAVLAAGAFLAGRRRR